MRKSLLYIGHAYHNKTNSTQFLQRMFAEKYDIETISIDPLEQGMDEALRSHQGREFDCIVVFQIFPDVEALRRTLTYRHATYFPMYDQCKDTKIREWMTLRDFQIINFSSTLHAALLDMGLSSHYIQFFPEPRQSENDGALDSVFFWQRLSQLNAAVVERLFENIAIKRFHIHKAVDPMHRFVEPSKKMTSISTFSTWYESRGEMLDEIMKSAFYVAPREYEGIGMSFLEAMAMGRCVVAVNNPTMNEYIEDGKTGLLFDLRDPQPLDGTFDFRKIQKNTIEYITQGYKRFEEEKHRILDWIELPATTDEKRMHKALLASSTTTEKHYFLRLIPILTITHSPQKTNVRLFGVIPILRMKKTAERRKIYLFSIIPIWNIQYS